MRAELRQQARRPIFRSLAEEHRAKLETAAHRLLDDAKPFDSALARRGQLTPGKRLAQFFYQRIMPALNAPQASRSCLPFVIQVLLARPAYTSQDHTRLSASVEHSCYLTCRK